MESLGINDVAIPFDATRARVYEICQLTLQIRDWITTYVIDLRKGVLPVGADTPLKDVFDEIKDQDDKNMIAASLLLEKYHDD